MKTVSVIIAAYAAENFIGEALESVLMQNIPEGYKLDVIVGVDGCDETWNAVSALNYKNVRYLKMERNQGTYVTFNTMMEYTNPDLIVRFDADDIMFQDYLANQIDFLKHNQDVDIIRTLSIYVDVNKRPIRASLENNTFTAENGESPRAAAGQFMMRKEVWEEMGGFKPWKCAADSEFFTRAKIFGFNKAATEQFGYMRRVHENSITQLKDTAIESDIRQKYVDLIAYNREHGMTKEECFVVGVTGNVTSVLP
jgi:glycosyltransferase involved in cell wall biosynthesis